MKTFDKLFQKYSMANPNSQDEKSALEQMVKLDKKRLYNLKIK